MSSTATSGWCLPAMARASSPVAACATTSMSGSSSSSATSAWRTIVWSSAIMIRTVTRSLSCLRAERDDDAKQKSLRLDRPGRELAAEAADPLGKTSQPGSGRARAWSGSHGRVRPALRSAAGTAGPASRAASSGAAGPLSLISATWPSPGRTRDQDGRPAWHGSAAPRSWCLPGRPRPARRRPPAAGCRCRWSSIVAVMPAAVQQLPGAASSPARSGWRKPATASRTSDSD